MIRNSLRSASTASYTEMVRIIPIRTYVFENSPDRKHEDRSMTLASKVRWEKSDLKNMNLNRFIMAFRSSLLYSMIFNYNFYVIFSCKINHSM
uniref:Uncharacterized protein n=1 Tax=Romanomermis culicivorax TaxID=13658 RepID=A0A915L7G8_ROMCU